MGNKPPANSGNAFTKEECDVLQTTFRDLSDRSTTHKGLKGCDKDTFLRFFFHVPGLIGERLFYVFDSKKDGVIDFEEFLQGLKVISRGSHMERVEFLFQIFDIDGNKKIEFNEMEALMTNISDAIHASGRPDLAKIDFQALARAAFDSKKELDRVGFDGWVGQHPEILQLFDFAFTGSSLLNGATAAKEPVGEVKMDISGVGPGVNIRKVVHKYSGFGTGSLASPHARTGGNAQAGFVPSLLGTKSPSTPAPPKTQNPQIKTQGFTPEQALNLPGGKRLPCGFCGYVLLLRHCFKCGLEVDPTNDKIMCSSCGELVFGVVRCVSCGSAIEARVHSASQAAKVDVASRRAEPKEGHLFKIGKRMGRQKQMWIILRDHFLYSFKKRKDEIPKQVLFMEGCFIESVNHEQQHAKLKFGIEIIVSEQPKKVSRFFYADSAEDRSSWISALQEHANVHNVDDYYVIGKELGIGRFSTVREAISKATGEMFAIKIIDKFQMDEKEREALQTEVAVLKLMSHPNVVRLQAVFETRRQLHIVMSFVSGGDLFERIEKSKNFDELNARLIMTQLCSAVKYLHSRGIVHRDLKPENIMMSSKTSNDIIIGDFGLSKFTGSREKMNIACGTLAYVAPEVLRMEGYGKGVDLWSLGVIMYLILRGRLPFDDEDEEALIEKAKEGVISFAHPIWDETSTEAKDLIRGLLRVDPTIRLDIDQMVAHPWFRIQLPLPLRVPQPPVRLSPANSASTGSRRGSAAPDPMERAPVVTRVPSKTRPDGVP